MTEYRKTLEQRINQLELARHAPNVHPGSGSIHSKEWEEFRENQRKIKVLERVLDELGQVTSLE